jgi:thioredoxin 1
MRCPLLPRGIARTICGTVVKVEERTMRRISTLLAGLVVGLMIGFAGLSAARAADVSTYTPEAFAAAQAADKPILVFIQAPWCPTCAVQRPVLKQIEAEADYKDLHVLMVDFDTQKDVVRQMGATMQSTLVVFRGKQEVARSVGDTNADSIRATVRRSLV